MTLDQLSQLLGKNTKAFEAIVLAREFPSLKASTLDLAPDENVAQEHYLSSESEGIQVRHSDAGTIEVIFLMSEGRHGFSQYRRALGKGLAFAADASSVAQALGEPTIRKPARVISFIGQVGETMRYDYPTHSVHFQFLASGTGVELITLTIASSTPGREV